MADLHLVLDCYVYTGGLPSYLRTGDALLSLAGVGWGWKVRVGWGEGGCRTEVSVDGERGTVPRWRRKWRSGRVRDVSQQSIASNRRFQNHEMEYDRSVVGRCRLCWLAAGACVGVSEGVRA